MNGKAVELLNLIDSVSEEEAGAIAVLCKGTPLHKAIAGTNTSAISTDIMAMAEELSLPRRTSSLLKNLGIPLNIYGHGYLQTAIEAVSDKPRLLHAITKELYPLVATSHHTTPSRVERALRHSIEVAYSRGDANLMKKILPCVGSSGKATNSEFIAAVAEFLRDQD